MDILSARRRIEIWPNKWEPTSPRSWSIARGRSCCKQQGFLKGWPWARLTKRSSRLKPLPELLYFFPYHSANGSASTPSTWEDSVLGFQPGWSEPCAEQSPGALLETANFGTGSLPSCWVLGMAKGALGMAKGAYSALISFFAFWLHTNK